MTGAELDIIIGANVDDAISSFKKLGYQITQTEQKATKAGQKSAQAFTDFNRVIQDAPFGFIAIQNNIGPLIDSFKIMRTEAKEAGVSLGSVLKGALSGPAGLGLAISAVTAAITFLQVGFNNWFRSSKESAEGANEFAESLRNISEEAEAAKNKMASFATSLEAMQSIWAAQNKVRFFGNDAEANLLDAKNNIGFVIAEYDKLGHAVDEAMKNSQKALDVFSNVVAARGQGSAQATEAEKEYNKVLNVQYDLEKQREAKGNELAKARAQRDLAQLQFDKEISDAAKKRSEEEKKAAQKRIKDYNDSYAALIRLLDTSKKVFRDRPITAPYEPIQITGTAFTLSDLEAQAAMTKMRDTLREAGQKVFNAQGILSGVDLLNDAELKKNFDEFENKVKLLTFDLTQTLKDAFVTLGEGIGNAISGMKNPFGALFELFGTTIKAFGTKLIEYAVIMKGLKIALKSFNPYLSLAAGIALVALGQVIQNAVPKFATGGVVTKPTLALVGEQGPERITPLGFEGMAGKVIRVEIEGFISNNVIRLANRRAEAVAFNTF